MTDERASQTLSGAPLQRGPNRIHVAQYWGLLAMAPRPIQILAVPASHLSFPILSIFLRSSPHLLHVPRHRVLHFFPMERNPSRLHGLITIMLTLPLLRLVKRDRLVNPIPAVHTAPQIQRPIAPARHRQPWITGPLHHQPMTTPTTHGCFVISYAPADDAATIGVPPEDEEISIVNVPVLNPESPSYPTYRSTFSCSQIPSVADPDSLGTSPEARVNRTQNESPIVDIKLRCHGRGGIVGDGLAFV